MSACVLFYGIMTEFSLLLAMVVLFPWEVQDLYSAIDKIGGKVALTFRVCSAIQI